MDAAVSRRDPRSKEQLLAEIGRLRASNLIEQIGQSVRTLIRGGCVCFVAYMAKEIISDLSGKATNANIWVNFLGSVSVNVTLAWGLAAAGVAYGMREKHLRRRTVSAMAGRKSQLERNIDPSRSSSGLTKTGDTHPEDDEQ